MIATAQRLSIALFALIMAALPLRPQAVEALASIDLPAALVQEIRSAKASPEGHPARIEVKAAADDVTESFDNDGPVAELRHWFG